MYNKPLVIEESSYSRNVWFIKSVNESKVEDLLEPNYWSNVAQVLRAGDRIEVVPDDRHYFVELFVLGASKNWAKVVLLRNITLYKDNEKEVGTEFVIDFGGPHKWRVRTTTGDVLVKDLETKEAASIWLEKHKKDMK